MKKFYKMFLYNMKMTLREKEALFWMFLFPILIVLIMGFVFGSSGEIKLSIGIVDLDQSFASREFVDGFTGEIEKQEGQPLEITVGDFDSEYAEFKDGNRNGLFVIEEGFGESLNAYYMFYRQGSSQDTGSLEPAIVKIYVDESNPSTSEITKQTMEGIASGLSSNIAGVPEMVKVEEQKEETEDFDYMDYMVPGILAMTIMFAGLMGYAAEISTYREKGILRRVKASPLSLSTFLGSGISSVLILSLVQAAVLLIVGTLVFKVKINGNYLYMAVVVLIGSISFLTLGFMISSLAKTAKSSNLAAMAVAMPMMFLSGIFFSLDWVPRAMAIIAQCLPLYYFGDALREVMINAASLADVWLDLVVLIGFGIVCFAVSVKFFRWDVQ